MKRYSQQFSLIIMLCFLIMNSSIFAAVVHIPDDHPSIQSGIDAAKDGDTVLVKPGTYTGDGNVNIDFKGKRITVESQNGPRTTIIDCKEKAETRGIIFQNQETSDSVLDGFTIKNGNHEYSGGVFCYDASPLIKNCIITQNRNNGVYLSGGITFGGERPIPTLIDCIISENTSNGLYSRSFLLIEIRGCTIARNSARGVVCISNYSFENNIISHSIIEQNGKGGIELSTNSNLKITESIIRQNTAESGGGITCSRTCNLEISNCLIAENIATKWGGGLDIESWLGKATISHCTITQNSAGIKGGGIYFSSTPANRSVLNVTNSIIWNNKSDGTYPEVLLTGNGISIQSSNIKDGLQGIKRKVDGKLFVYEDNIDIDPLFVNVDNGDYRLKPDSPAAAMGAHATIENLLSVNSVGKILVQWANIKKNTR